MKCQILFSGKNKKNISICCLMKISADNIEIFSYFSRKKVLTFHANCLETICLKCQSCFLGKIRLISPEW